jgi:hypothetical protein
MKKKVLAVTTFNRSYYDGLAKRMVETFIKFWPKEVMLVCYLEDMEKSELPSAPNVIGVNVFERCNPNLQNYLDFIGDHFSRGFAYKAFTWIDSARTFKDFNEVIYLDADVITYKPVTEQWLDNVLPDNNLVAYMGVTMNKGKWKGIDKPHSDSGLYWFNPHHPYAKTFVDRYENIYNSHVIKEDKTRFPKPNDAYVLIDCILDAEAHGVQCRDFHPERKALSPLKETELGKYFRHFKAARKQDPEMDAFINAIIAGADPEKLEEEHKGKVNLKEQTDTRFVREWKNK